MRGRADTAALSVVLIEDDDTIGRHLVLALRNQGYEIDWQRNGRTGLHAARQLGCQVVLLDLGLPDGDGVDIARKLRSEQPDLLILILTARGDSIDIVAGLDAGADDYLVKPFDLTVLLARLRAHLRSRPLPETGAESVRVGPLELDLAARRCIVASHEVSLRPKEFELLAVLVAHAGRAVTREDLMARIWDENWFGSTKTLDVTIAALRRRLSEAARPVDSLVEDDLPTITTLRGYGYRLDHFDLRAG